VANLGCGVAQFGCGTAQLRCGVAQLWCGVSQFVARLTEVSQPKFETQHPMEATTERTAMRKLMRNSLNVINECARIIFLTYSRKNKLTESNIVSPNL
jgi:hypothetical protein